MPRQRYRRYFEPESNVTVPRQTASNATKRARTSDTSQNAKRARGNGAGIVCPGGSTDSTTGGHTNCSQGQSTDPEEDGSQVQNSKLEAGLSTSEPEGEVPTGHNNNAPDFSHPGNQSSHNCDSNTERMPCDQAPEEGPDAELSERELSGSSDDFSEYLGKLSEETISHQSTTKAQVLLLVLAYVVTAGLTWTQVKGLLTLLNALFGEVVVPSTTYLLRKMWKKKMHYDFTCTAAYVTIILAFHTKFLRKVTSPAVTAM
ncbi:hypothetical protein MTO96_023173 [Rhipicephalus appendiculatus]